MSIQINKAFGIIEAEITRISTSQKTGFSTQQESDKAELQLFRISNCLGVLQGRCFEVAGGFCWSEPDAEPEDW